MANISKVLIGSEESILKFIQTELNSSPINSIEELELEKVKYDLYTIAPEKDRKFIKTEQLDPSFAFAYRKPHLSKSSYLVIWKAQALNSVSQNKLLKLIEEPPEYLNVFLCLTEPGTEDRLIATIRSRTEVIKLDGETKLDLTELDKITDSFLSLNSLEIKNGYNKLDEMLGKLKSNEEKRQLWGQFCKIVSTKLPPLLKSSPKKTELIIELLNKIRKGIESNVNQKLLANHVFLSFQKFSQLD